MIEHELLFLGLLKESPKHGYEIKIKIREILTLFAGVELKSIYYPLRILEKKGFLHKSAAKPGRRPQKFVYQLTPKGEARFNTLLADSFLNSKRPQFSLDLSIYFLKYIRSDIGKRRLRGRIFILNKIAAGMKIMLRARNKDKLIPTLRLIMEHNLEMLEAEAVFLSRLSGVPWAKV